MCVFVWCRSYVSGLIRGMLTVKHTQLQLAGKYRNQIKCLMSTTTTAIIYIDDATRSVSCAAIYCLRLFAGFFVSLFRAVGSQFSVARFRLDIGIIRDMRLRVAGESFQTFTLGSLYDKNLYCTHNSRRRYLI